MDFSIDSQFKIDGKPFTILSGAVHYFRIHPSQWHTTLQNLKNLGFNTVETYIPWNGHEPHQGQFNWSDQYDLNAFVDCAAELDLHVILRPTPYICAEWEFGGLPAWLIPTGARLRSSDPRFLAAVQNYYDVLLPKLVPMQSTHGGPVIMMQLENEYGSFGQDTEYLKAIKAMLEAGGIDVPLFTADGTWDEALAFGALADEGVLTTGNYGSHADENFDALAAFHRAHGKNWPLMCMEYWDGWFNRWGMPVVRRDASEFADDIDALLKRGSLNLYMFRGGTNFGFMNGCSARGIKDLPQVTSYDYDAPLTEWGAPTAKYAALQRVIAKRFPNVQQAAAITPITHTYGRFTANGYANLLDVVDQLETSHDSLYPQTFEQLDNPYGYVLYRTQLEDFGHTSDLRIVEAGDRLQVYENDAHLATQAYEEIGETLPVNGGRLDVLIENLGRVNYGYKLNAATQSKGIRGGVMVDHQFRLDWQQYALTFDDEMIEKIPWSSGPAKVKNVPIFTHFSVDVETIANTFIDCSLWGKGCVVVNGVNIGRYWRRGPIHTLYVPDGLLKAHNEIVVFETEGADINSLSLVDAPLIDNAKA